MIKYVCIYNREVNKMKYVYTEKDLDLISWDRIDQFIDKIYLDVKKYI